MLAHGLMMSLNAELSYLLIHSYSTSRACPIAHMTDNTVDRVLMADILILGGHLAFLTISLGLTSCVVREVPKATGRLLSPVSIGKSVAESCSGGHSRYSDGAMRLSSLQTRLFLILVRAMPYQRILC